MRFTPGGVESQWVLSYQSEEEDPQSRKRLNGSRDGTLKADRGGQQSVGDVMITTASYADLDKDISETTVAGGIEEGEQSWRPAVIGRRSFGKFNKLVEVRDKSIKTTDRFMINRG